MRQDQVLLVADPDLAVAVALGEVGDEFHLLRGGVAGRAADRLERDGGDGMARDPVRHRVLRDPARETVVLRHGAIEHDAFGRARRQRRRQGEIGADAVDLGFGQGERRVADALPFLLDLATDLLGAGLVDEDLDPRLELVVAPAELVVDAKDRLAIGEHVLFRQEIADLVGDERRPPEPAADIDRETQPAGLVALEVEADVMDLHRRAVVLRAGDGDLELPRQEDEFRVERRPLPKDLGIGPRIGDLVARGAGEMVGGDVSDAVARGLDRVHLDRGEMGEDVRDVLERRPVELEVLPGREMAVAAVVLPRDEGEHAELHRVQRAVGHRDPQHVGVELQVDAVHQPERLELVLGQVAGDPTLDLAAELGDPFGNELPVELVVAVHDSGYLMSAAYSAAP